MVDQEVADILAEIRDKVRASNGAGAREIDSPASDQSIKPLEFETYVDTNGFAGLTVLSRSWDRLPPLVTNRTGVLARIDLWLKGILKRALRWITWEQVNFNAATHQTFIEVVEALQQQKNVFKQLVAETEVTRQKLESHQRELESHRRELDLHQHEVRVRKEQADRQQATVITQLEKFSSQIASFNALQTDLRVRIDALNSQQESSGRKLESLQTFQSDEIKSLDDRFVQLVDEFHELVGEFRGRDERLFDEQRVSLKQFSLELSETQVMQDRARRELETRLVKLETNNE